jgi:hypothetical protein
MLPTLIAPHHEVKLFSLKKPVTFRPYIVAEEKIFLTAAQSGDPREVENAVKQVITNVTSGAVNVDKLPSFDLEYLFLQMRARSVNNLIEVPFNCNNQVPSTTSAGLMTTKCKGSMVVNIDIDTIKLFVPEGHTNKFWITDDVGVQFKYPTYETMERLHVKCGGQSAGFDTAEGSAGDGVHESRGRPRNYRAATRRTGPLRQFTHAAAGRDLASVLRNDATRAIRVRLQMPDMRVRRTRGPTGVDGFFRIGQSHDTLPNFYTLNFNLWKHHGLSFDTIERMLPYERDLNVMLLQQWIEEEKRRAERERIKG